MCEGEREPQREYGGVGLSELGMRTFRKPSNPSRKPMQGDARAGVRTGRVRLGLVAGTQSASALAKNAAIKSPCSSVSHGNCHQVNGRGVRV